MGSRQRLEELSLLNVLFCLLVVFIHVLSQAVSSLDRLSWQYALVLIPQRLAFVSVPGFFFLSGLKLTLPREHPVPLGRYYLGRAKALLLPYLLAAAIYYLFFVAIGWYSFSPGQFLRETALGSLSAQFYFLIALIQFILLTPLFRALSRRWDPILLLPLALGVTWLSSMYLPSVLQLFVPDSSFPYSALLFTSYLVYYLAGCCAGSRYPRFLALLEENFPLLCWSTLFFGSADAIVSVLAFSGRRNAPYLEMLHTLYILSAILLLCCCAARHKELMRGAGSPLLTSIDRASYLIYLYHCLVITIFNIFAPRVVGSRIAVLLLLRMITVYLTTIAGCVLWQRLWAAVRKAIRHE